MRAGTVPAGKLATAIHRWKRLSVATHLATLLEAIDFTPLIPSLCNLGGSSLPADSVDRKLQDALAPTVLNIINDSHKHAGHAGNPGGEPDAETHFRIEVTDAP